MAEIKEGVNIPLGINIIVTDHNDSPCIEFRRRTNDIDIIKKILSCAFHEKPMLILPKFTDKLKSINTLLQKGVIYRNEDGKYYFVV